jgi:DNA-binding response OmpR family regulator
VVLPGVDGFAVAERLGASAPTVPILMLTIVDERERAARLGIAGYLSKPFDTDELLRQVRRLARVPAHG